MILFTPRMAQLLRKNKPDCRLSLNTENNLHASHPPQKENGAYLRKQIAP